MIGLLGDVQFATLALSVTVIAVIVKGQATRSLARAPAALIVVVGSIVASLYFNFGHRGTAALDDVPSGLPSFQRPPPPPGGC